MKIWSFNQNWILIFFSVYCFSCYDPNGTQKQNKPIHSLRSPSVKLSFAKVAWGGGWVPFKLCMSSRLIDLFTYHWSSLCFCFLFFSRIWGGIFTLDGNSLYVFTLNNLHHSNWNVQLFFNCSLKPLSGYQWNEWFCSK